jgi:hypothetical protein
MKVDLADKRAVCLDDTPAATGRIIAVAPTNPAELDSGTAIALDRVGHRPSAAISSKEVDRIAVREVHLHDLPKAGHPRHHAPKRGNRRPAVPDGRRLVRCSWLSARSPDPRRRAV